MIQSLVAEVKQITQSMLLQLLQRLRSNIQVKGIVLYQEARTYPNLEHCFLSDL